MFKNLKLKAFCAFIITTFTVQASLASNFDDGINSFENQNYNEAVKYFEKSAQENPDDPEPHKWLAKCYSELFMLELSLKEYDKVKRLQDKRALIQKSKLIEEKKEEVKVETEKPTSINIIVTQDNYSRTEKYIGKKKLKIAILDFKDRYTYNYNKKFTQSITEYLTSNILNSGLGVVERSQIDEITRELKFQNSEFVLNKSAKKIGKIYGIDYLMVGYVLDFSHDKKVIRPFNLKQRNTIRNEAAIRISAKLINVENGEIDYSEVLSDIYQNVSYENENISDFELEDKLMNNISNKISKKIIGRLNSKFLK